MELVYIGERRRGSSPPTHVFGIFVVVVVLGFELRASHLLGRHSTV
jgi:hypothetical protein